MFNWLRRFVPDAIAALGCAWYNIRHPRFSRYKLVDDIKPVSREWLAEQDREL